LQRLVLNRFKALKLRQIRCFWLNLWLLPCRSDFGSDFCGLWFIRFRVFKITWMNAITGSSLLIMLWVLPRSGSLFVNIVQRWQQNLRRFPLLEFDRKWFFSPHFFILYRKDFHVFVCILFDWWLLVLELMDPRLHLHKQQLHLPEFNGLDFIACFGAMIQVEVWSVLFIVLRDGSDFALILVKRGLFDKSRFGAKFLPDLRPNISIASIQDWWQPAIDWVDRLLCFCIRTRVLWVAPLFTGWVFLISRFAPYHLDLLGSCCELGLCKQKGSFLLVNYALTFFKWFLTDPLLRRFS
jgi:hypothetical protein